MPMQQGPGGRRWNEQGTNEGWHHHQHGSASYSPAPHVPPQPYSMPPGAVFYHSSASQPDNQQPSVWDHRSHDLNLPSHSTGSLSWARPDSGAQAMHSFVGPPWDQQESGHQRQHSFGTASSGSGSSFSQPQLPHYYAAVPCIMVPTGQPVFYSTGHAYPPLESLHGPCLRSGNRLALQSAPAHTPRRSSFAPSSCGSRSPFAGSAVMASYAPSTGGSSAVVAISTNPSCNSELDCRYPQSGHLPPVGQQPTCWGELTVGILQYIINRVPETEAKQLRGVNHHWRSAVDQNLDALTPSSLMSKLITLRFPNLRLLHLTNCSNVRNRDFKLLSRAGLRLHTLSIGDDVRKPWVSNIGLAWIGQVTTLTSLNLHDCVQLTNRGMEPLRQLRGLAALSLKGCDKINNQGLEVLRHNTALTSLNLAGLVRVSDRGVLHLAALPRLMHLNLGRTRIRDEGMGYLATITSLHELQFDGEAMTDAGLMQLTALSNLQMLALRECPQITGDALSALVPRLPALQSLDLFQSYEFDDQQLSKCLDFLGSLTSLDLRGTEVSEDGIQQLARLHNLQKLCLAPKHELRVEHSLFSSLSHLTQLTSLAINNCSVSFDLISSLMHLKLLRELDVSNEGKQVLMRTPENVVVEEPAAEEPVNDGAIRAMTHITSLTSLDLSRRFVHEEQLNTLAEQLPRLRALYVVGCPVVEQTLQAMQRRFPELQIHRKPHPHDSAHSSAGSEHSWA